MWQRFKQTYLWKHRTKNLGGFGILAGYGERFLESHDHLPLWLLHQRGTLLMGFGAAVGAVGLYNSLKDWFGWTDE